MNDAHTRVGPLEERAHQEQKVKRKETKELTHSTGTIYGIRYLPAPLTTFPELSS